MEQAPLSTRAVVPCAVVEVSFGHPCVPPPPHHYPLPCGTPTTTLIFPPCAIPGGKPSFLAGSQVTTAELKAAVFETEGELQYLQLPGTAEGVVGVDRTCEEVRMQGSPEWWTRWAGWSVCCARCALARGKAHIAHFVYPARRIPGVCHFKQPGHAVG